MSDNEAKALELVAEAEKKLNSSKSFFGGLFGRQNKQGEALRCYERAANLFKMAKKWSQAGNTFVTAAEVSMYSFENYHSLKLLHIIASYQACQ